MKLSIIIPTYNESNTIDGLIKYVQSVSFPIDYEIIIIDDASVDRTLEKEFLIKQKNKFEKNNIRIFRNRLNRGKGFSIRKGIRRAKGDILIIQDADMEYDPSDIPKLIDPLIKGEAEVVYGSRFLNSARPEGMAFPNWIANKVLTKITNMLFGLRLTDMETCYKVFRASIIKGIKLRTNRFTFEPEISALLAKRKIKIKELPIKYHGRTSREGKKIKAIDFVFAVLVLFWQRLTP
ncbi:MAG: glycosyltransferase family 2 protein [Candidatus Omnitrophota bacterium]|nr:glycosyltransferase family 2 protein [Candidatus Omnitrophota bacterium]